MLLYTDTKDAIYLYQRYYCVLTPKTLKTWTRFTMGRPKPKPYPHNLLLRLFLWFPCPIILRYFYYGKTTLALSTLRCQCNPWSIHGTFISAVMSSVGLGAKWAEPQLSGPTEVCWFTELSSGDNRGVLGVWHTSWKGRWGVLWGMAVALRVKWGVAWERRCSWYEYQVRHLKTSSTINPFEVIAVQKTT
jgi:hypothetical protein